MNGLGVGIRRATQCLLPFSEIFVVVSFVSIMPSERLITDGFYLAIKSDHGKPLPAMQCVFEQMCARVLSLGSWISPKRSFFEGGGGGL